MQMQHGFSNPHVPRPPKHRHHAGLHEPGLHTCVRECGDYYAIFSHSLQKITVSFDTQSQFVDNSDCVWGGQGYHHCSVADTPGARTLESMVPGPVIVLQQPGSLTALTAQQRWRELEVGSQKNCRRGHAWNIL
jgi:hypothetical protein